MSDDKKGATMVKQKEPKDSSQRWQQFGQIWMLKGSIQARIKKTERKEIRPGMVEHMCSHRIWEDEAGISLIPGESDYITRIFDKK